MIVSDFHGFGFGDLSPRMATAFLEVSAKHYPERLCAFLVRMLGCKMCWNQALTLRVFSSACRPITVSRTPGVRSPNGCGDCAPCHGGCEGHHTCSVDVQEAWRRLWARPPSSTACGAWCSPWWTPSLGGRSRCSRAHNHSASLLTCLPPVLGDRAMPGASAFSEPNIETHLFLGAATTRAGQGASWRRRWGSCLSRAWCSGCSQRWRRIATRAFLLKR